MLATSADRTAKLQPFAASADRTAKLQPLNFYFREMAQVEKGLLLIINYYFYYTIIQLNSNYLNIIKLLLQPFATSWRWLK